MKHAISITKHLIFVMLSLSLVLLTSVSAEENNSPSKLKNIGFIKNPPKELKQKFPMCDQFLKVKWVDKQKMVGISEYELYKDGKKINKKWLALLYLDQTYPRLDFNLDQYQKQGNIHSLYSLIEKGEIKNSDSVFNAKDTSREINLKRIHFSPDDMTEISLSDHTQNICVTYPNSLKVWIAEGKRVEKIYSQEEIKKTLVKLESFLPKLSSLPNSFLQSEVIDFNFDGLEDYFRYTLYSNQGRYYRMTPMWTRETDNTLGKYKFPPSEKTCEIWPDSFYLTTDGKSYFLNNTCNLTELTK